MQFQREIERALGIDSAAGLNIGRAGFDGEPMQGTPRDEDRGFPGGVRAVNGKNPQETKRFGHPTDLDLGNAPITVFFPRQVGGNERQLEISMRYKRLGEKHAC